MTDQPELNDAPDSAPRCDNCKAQLTGQYCALCGQRDKNRVISVWALLSEFVGDLFELDSRLWRTVFPLIFSPGKLTVEYLQGRRVHYTPPVRLYLVTSLVFFVVAFFDTQIGDVVDLSVADDNDLIVAPIVVPPDPVGTEPDAATGPELSTETPADPDAPTVTNPGQQQKDFNPENFQNQSGIENCNDIQFGDTEFEKRIATRIRTVCEKLKADGGLSRFITSFVDKLPAMMFVFLPVIALFMKALYPFSRRYYVEHLLFLLHFHSFFFLSWTVLMLWSRVPEIVGAQQIISVVATIILLIYTPVYLFRAMGRVYNQALFVRVVKFVILTLAYAVSLLTLFFGMLILTALSL